jgi:hypothetical protein
MQIGGAHHRTEFLEKKVEQYFRTLVGKPLLNRPVALKGRRPDRIHLLMRVARKPECALQAIRFALRSRRQERSLASQDQVLSLRPM